MKRWKVSCCCSHIICFGRFGKKFLCHRAKSISGAASTYYQPGNTYLQQSYSSASLGSNRSLSRNLSFLERTHRLRSKQTLVTRTQFLGSGSIYVGFSLEDATFCGQNTPSNASRSVSSITRKMTICYVFQVRIHGLCLQPLVVSVPRFLSPKIYQSPPATDALQAMDLRIQSVRPANGGSVFWSAKNFKCWIPQTGIDKHLLY